MRDGTHRAARRPTRQPGVGRFRRAPIRAGVPGALRLRGGAARPPRGAGALFHLAALRRAIGRHALLPRLGAAHSRGRMDGPSRVLRAAGVRVSHGGRVQDLRRPSGRHAGDPVAGRCLHGAARLPPRSRGHPHLPARARGAGRARLDFLRAGADVFRRPHADRARRGVLLVLRRPRPAHQDARLAVALARLGRARRRHGDVRGDRALRGAAPDRRRAARASASDETRGRDRAAARRARRGHLAGVAAQSLRRA